MPRPTIPGEYRMAWDRESAIRVFLDAVADLDAEAELASPGDGLRRVSVLGSLRERLLPVFRDLAVTPEGFVEAVHALLVSDYRCGSLPLIEADAVRQATQPGDGDAAAREAALARCVAHRSEPCSAVAYMTSVIDECQRLGGQERCLGLRATAGRNRGPAGWTCADFRALDEGVRECWRVNGPACHALPILAKGGEESACEPASPAGEDLEPAAVELVEAIWGWALDPFRLVAPREELYRLSTSQLGDFFSPEMAYHRDFLFCVYHTLRAMAESPGGVGVRRWVMLGEPLPGPTEPLLNDMRRMPDFVEDCTEQAAPLTDGPGGTPEEAEGGGKEQVEVFRVRHADSERYEIVFRPRKWIPGTSESGPAAVGRIVAEFKVHLERMLDAQGRRQLEAGNLVHARKERLTPDRARLLALYQVHGETLAVAGKTHPDLKLYEQKYISDAAGRWTREDAETLVGPHFAIWFREPRIGFPKGKKRGPGSGGGPNG